MHPPVSFLAVRRRPALAAFLVAAVVATTFAGPWLAGAVAGPVASEWPMVGGDPAHSGAAGGPEPPYRRAWEAQIGGAGPAAGPVVGQGTVVVVGWDRVAALDAVDGSSRWEIERKEGPAGPAVVAGDLVVFAEGRGTGAAVVAVALDDGDRAWRVPTRAIVAGGLTGADGHVYMGSRDGIIRALDVETGGEVWSFEGEGRSETAPAVAGGLVIVAAEDFQTGTIAVHALDAGSGRVRWSLEPEGPAIGLSSAAVQDEVVTIGLGTFRTLGLGLRDGEERWSVRLRSAYSARFVPAAWQDVLMGDRVGHVYRIDAASGEQRWVHRLPGHLLVGGPVVVGEAVVVGDGSGQVSALSLESGDLVWRESLGGDAVGALASDGERLYAAPRLGAVIAYEHDPSGVLLDEPSPTTLFVEQALLNFAMAALPLGLLLFLLLSRLRARRQEAPIVPAEPERDRSGNGAGGDDRGRKQR